MSKKEPKKVTISKRTLILLCVTVAISWIMAGIVLFIKYDGDTLFANGDVTVEKIEKEAKSLIESKPYALLTLDVQERIKDDDVYTYHYQLSSEKGTKKHSYVYLDSKGQSLYQYWDYKESNGTYLIYIYDDKHETWVETSYSYEPISSDTWNMLNDLSNYTLLPDLQNWYGTEDECYVLEMVGSNDEFAQMYEQLFIRKSDYMPMGIVSYGVSDVNYDKMVTGGAIEFETESGKVTGEVQTPSYNEYIQRYSIEFSDDDKLIFGVPDEYITEKEYVDLYGEEFEGSESDEQEEVIVSGDSIVVDDSNK